MSEKLLIGVGIGLFGALWIAGAFLLAHYLVDVLPKKYQGSGGEK